MTPTTEEHVSTAEQISLEEISESQWLEVLDSSLEYIGVHERRLAMLDEMYQRQRESILEKVAYHKANVEAAAIVGKKAMGTSKLTAPSGTATVRTKKGTFVVTDKEAALATAKTLHERGVACIKESVVNSALRAALTEQEDGSLVDQRTGEEVTFARVEGKGELSVSYKLTGEGDE